MRIHSVTGNIFDFAPTRAEACALWLRSGFNMRGTTWRFKFLRTYAERLQPVGVDQTHITIKRPWVAGTDSLYRLEPPDQHLQWLYIFANPNNAHGYEDCDAVRRAVVRCLDRLAFERVESVAMILVPVAINGDFPTREDSIESAGCMVDELRRWDDANPGRIDEVFLVDLRGDFAQVVPPDLA